jgi:hypothetical protein
LLGGQYVRAPVRLTVLADDARQLEPRTHRRADWRAG